MLKLLSDQVPQAKEAAAVSVPSKVADKLLAAQDVDIVVTKEAGRESTAQLDTAASSGNAQETNAVVKNEKSLEEHQSLPGNRQSKVIEDTTAPVIADSASAATELDSRFQEVLQLLLSYVRND